MKDLANATMMTGGAMVGAVCGTIYSFQKNMPLKKSVGVIGLSILLGAGAMWAISNLTSTSSKPKTAVADDL